MRIFKPEDKLIRSEKMLSTELDHETVLMSIEAGAYYGMGGPARSIWETLATPMTFASLVDRLVEEYSVTPEVCAADLQKFLADMEQEGLVRVE